MPKIKGKQIQELGELTVAKHIARVEGKSAPMVLARLKKARIDAERS